MLDREQQLIDAAMRYQTLLAGSQPVSIRDFVAAVDPDLRDELAEYLEFLLLTPEPQEPIVLSAEEQALADRVAERTNARLQQRMAAAAPAQTLTALRQARKLSMGALATQINLPVDLLHRIERGGVRAATIPDQLIARLAGVLQQAEAEIRTALTGPQLSTAGMRLSAEDATTIAADEAVDFAEALAASSATDAQKAEWG